MATVPRVAMTVPARSVETCRTLQLPREAEAASHLRDVLRVWHRAGAGDELLVGHAAAPFVEQPCVLADAPAEAGRAGGCRLVDHGGGVGGLGRQLRLHLI